MVKLDPFCESVDCCKEDLSADKKGYLISCQLLDDDEEEGAEPGSPKGPRPTAPESFAYKYEGEGIPEATSWVVRIRLNQ